MRFYRVLFAYLAVLVSLADARKKAVATFYNGGVSGTIVFDQDRSVNAPVNITVSLGGLEGLAGDYHVHELPVNSGGSGIKVSSFGDNCGASNTAGHFNPTKVAGGNGVPGDYLCSPNATSLCEVGDISGKFGSLVDLDEYRNTLVDSTMTLFGTNSIIGRSVVIHRDDGNRWVCASIFEVPLDGSKISESVVTFDGDAGVKGTITLVQGTDLTVFSNLELTHDVASFPISLQSHAHRLYHPFAKSFATKCGSASLGAVAKNLSATNILSTFPLVVGVRTKSIHNIDVQFATLTNLQNQAVSFVSGGSILDCATVGKSGFAEFESSAAHGIISFTQGSTTSPVEIAIDVDHLGMVADGFHIHQLPVFSDCGSTGAHYDPFATASVGCTSGTPEKCEVGDLSGRIGSLLGRDVVAFTFKDAGAGLSLFGPNAVFGRSLVIHNTAGTRIACTNLNEFGIFATEKATFDVTKSVLGSITFTQRASDPDALTVVTVDISHVTPSQTLEHLFHVHASPVNTSEVEESQCATTGGHFNPTGVIGGQDFTGLGNYSCSSADRSFCEVGDLSGKFGKISIPSKLVFADSSIPLSGLNRISGRSVTFHAEASGSARIDCANLATGSVQIFPHVDDSDKEPVAEEEEQDHSAARVALITLVTLFSTMSIVIVGLVFYYKKADDERAKTKMIGDTKEGDVHQASL